MGLCPAAALGDGEDPARAGCLAGHKQMAQSGAATVQLDAAAVELLCLWSPANRHRGTDSGGLGHNCKSRS